jgi:RNA polymerase sigma-70 factor (ECF subfamily)
MAAGDVRAGAEFVRRHERKVYGIALAVTANRATAEDVAQEAFLAGHDHPQPGCRRPTPPASRTGRAG